MGFGGRRKIVKKFGKCFQETDQFKDQFKEECNGILIYYSKSFDKYILKSIEDFRPFHENKNFSLNFYISGVFYEACQTYNKVYFERKERENKAEEAFDKISFHVGEGIEFLDATYFLGEIERKVCNFCLREI